MRNQNHTEPVPNELEQIHAWLEDTGIKDKIKENHTEVSGRNHIGKSATLLHKQEKGYALSVEIRDTGCTINYKDQHGKTEIYYDPEKDYEHMLKAVYHYTDAPLTQRDTCSSLYADLNQPRLTDLPKAIDRLSEKLEDNKEIITSACQKADIQPTVIDNKQTDTEKPDHSKSRFDGFSLKNIFGHSTKTEDEITKERVNEAQMDLRIEPSQTESDVTLQK